MAGVALLLLGRVDAHGGELDLERGALLTVLGVGAGDELPGCLDACTLESFLGQRFGFGSPDGDAEPDRLAVVDPLLRLLVLVRLLVGEAQVEAGAALLVVDDLKVVGQVALGGDGVAAHAAFLRLVVR